MRGLDRRALRDRRVARPGRIIAGLAVLGRENQFVAGQRIRNQRLRFRNPRGVSHGNIFGE